MINLLPPAEREAITFARFNTQLRHWITGALAGLVGVLLFVGIGQAYLQQNVNTYQTAIDARKNRLAEQRQEETLQRVKGIQESFKLVVDVLSREVLFSKLLPQVGAVMPDGTRLEDLSLTTEDGQTAFDINAQATSYYNGTQIQVNLTDPANKLFEKADLVEVTCPDQAEDVEASVYPCKVSMRVLPAKENQFLLIPPEKKR